MKSTHLRQRKLVTEGSPDALFTLPTKDTWAEADYLDAPDLKVIGDGLIVARPELQHLEGAEIVYLLKQKGQEEPRRVLGKCQRPSGLLKHFAQADFVITLMANNLVGASKWVIEAIVYHELLHAGTNEKGEFCTLPHDCECFAQEIERYGLWKQDLQRIADAGAKALELPFDPAPSLIAPGKLTISLPNDTSTLQ